MPLTVNSNIQSLIAQQNLTLNGNHLATALQQLSSGKRVNSAADDPAGYAVITTMTTDVNGSTVAQRNANDGISVSQTAQSALSSVINQLQTIRELAVQAANGSISNSNRSQLQLEVDQNTQEIYRAVSTTEFNGNFLISGASNGLTFQVGSSGAASNQITTSAVDLSSLYGVSGGGLTATGIINITTSGGASAAISAIDAALATVTNDAATFGAVQNRFQSVVDNLGTYIQNVTASRSRIQDTDFASATAELTRDQILQQAGTSILSQANSLPQAALTLLTGH